jgi:hypothetical protein
VNVKSGRRYMRENTGVLNFFWKGTHSRINNGGFKYIFTVKGVEFAKMDLENGIN